jgi:RNA polymerase sigma-70 factor (ECF subfamily)
VISVGPAHERAAVERMGEPTVEPLDQDAFGTFYIQTARALNSYICRVSGDAAVADDILQESYIRLLNATQMKETERKPYLYRVASNLIADYWRMRSREQNWWRRAFRRSEAAPQNMDLSSDMARLFAKLGAQDRTLLWLAYVEGFDHREIGKILRLRDNSVRVLLFRARRRMRNILREHGFRGEGER